MENQPATYLQSEVCEKIKMIDSSIKKLQTFLGFDQCDSGSNLENIHQLNEQINCLYEQRADTLKDCGMNCIREDLSFECLCVLVDIVLH